MYRMNSPLFSSISAINSSSFNAAAPTPPESPLTFHDLPLDLTSSSSIQSAPSPSYSSVSSPVPSVSFRSPIPSTSRSRKRSRSISSITEEEAQYRLRRDKNNIAAKKSRDARRAREAETARKAQELEQLVVRLQAENEMLRQEAKTLKMLTMQFRASLPSECIEK